MTAPLPPDDRGPVVYGSHERANRGHGLPVTYRPTALPPRQTYGSPYPPQYVPVPYPVPYPVPVPQQRPQNTPAGNFGMGLGIGCLVLIFGPPILFFIFMIVIAVGVAVSR